MSHHAGNGTLSDRVTASARPREELLARARERGWYHVLDLGGGETTRGWFDLRPFLDRYGLPERLDGLRVLDVGTWDGFFAFEAERRGAAEVIALDLDDERELDFPPRRRPSAFPEELGRFDLVVCGSVLIHLRDQLLALERIAGLCRGTFISAEEYSRAAGLAPFPASRYLADRDKAVVFWLPSARTWRRMLWTAGFDQVRERGRFTLRATNGLRVRHVVHHAS